MKKILVVLFACSFYHCIAQPTTDQTDDKVYDHYIGAEIGPLIMHLFNASSNSIGSGNPYVVTYSMNNRETGWGIRAGIGCNFLNNSTATSVSTNTATNNDVQFRIGVEKIFEITNKWNAGAGVDITVNYNNDNTTTVSNQYSNLDTNTTSNTTTSFNYGGGIFGKINYHLSKKILLGTECSYYYVTGKNNQTVETIQQNGNVPPTTNETKANPAYSKGTISLPIVLYLLLKF